MEPTFERYIYPNTVPLHLTIPLRPEQGHLTHQSCNNVAGRHSLVKVSFTTAPMSYMNFS